MRTGPIRQRRMARSMLALWLVAAGSAEAARVSVELDGVDGPLRDATLAGLESAEAILSGDRKTFERHFDPRELGIRSESKPFEFSNPPGVQI